MKKIKFKLLILASSLIFFFIWGCGEKNENTIQMWTFMNHVKDDMVKVFEKENPGITINVTVYPEDTYYVKLKAALDSGINVPDIFDIERTYIGEFIEHDKLYDLSNYEASKLMEDYIPYVIALGKDSKGTLKGISDHTMVGGLFYNKAVAKKYIGTDDPTELSQLIKSWDDVINLSSKVSSEDDGVWLLATIEDVLIVEKYNNGNWVENEKLRIDDNWLNIIDICRKIRQANGDANLISWTTAWDIAKNNGTVLMWVQPLGAEVNNQNEYNKYGVIPAPKNYYYGGTYRFIYSESSKKDNSYKFIEFISGAKWQMEDVSRGVIPAKNNVLNEFKNKPVWSIMGDDPVLDVLQKSANEIPVNGTNMYDEQVFLIFTECVLAGIDDNKSNESILSDFKGKISTFYPNLEVN